MRSTPRARSRSRGFTLVELMVALMIAAIVISTVYTIGGASARNFQEQERVGQTQLSMRLGLDRLRRDIERAGMHGTPSSAVERMCVPRPAPAVNAVTLVDNDAGSRAALAAIPAAAANTTTQADSLTLTGNYSTSDAYLIRGIEGSGTVVQLQTSWQGFRRSFATADGTAFDNVRFREVFSPGRVLHITNLAGFHFFVTVVAAQVAANNASITFAPPIGIGGTCLGGLGEGATIAPLSRVVYSLQAAPADVPPPRDVQVSGPNTGLVRQELDMQTRAVISSRTILEWAIHFDVDAVVNTAPAGAVPVLARLDDAAAAARVTLAPQSTRALIVELGARTPEQDPGYPWVAPVAGAPLSRFQVFTNQVGAARVRTGMLEVSLPSLVYRGL